MYRITLSGSLTTFTFADCVSYVWFDKRINRHYGDAQWIVQTTWALFVCRWIDLYERDGVVHGYKVA